MSWEMQNFLLDLLTDASKHWLLAFSVGALAFLLTSTTWYVLSSAFLLLTRRKEFTGVDCGMFIFCLLVGLSLALLSHWGLDYFSIWWDTPLGPPLELY